MLYAQVVVGLPVEGPFDYSIPLSFHKRIKAGMRVWVSFRSRKILGYVVKITKETSVANLKPILDIIDVSPVLGKNLLSLTRELSDYYGCSWGEAIEAALPEGIRKGMPLPKVDHHPAPAVVEDPPKLKKNNSEAFNSGALLIHNWNSSARWDIYIEEIKLALSRNKSAVILLPDKGLIERIRKIIEDKTGCRPAALYRKQSQELTEWLSVKEARFSIVIGTRSCIFAPVNSLGLVIVEEEQAAVYKQEQVPHYHAREVAFMRAKIENAKLILGSSFPSLDSFYLSRKGKIKYVPHPEIKDFPEAKIIDMRHSGFGSKQRNVILSKYLQDSIAQVLNTKGKILLFLNRKGFATFALCRHCNAVLKCPRCDINLVFHFRENILNCHYCNFKMQPLGICPNCNSGYIQYLGVGTEKIESELNRIFPQAKVMSLDNLNSADIGGADIFISTEAVIKRRDCNFDLIGILSIDNSLSRIDFRSTEKAFNLLVSILGLTHKKAIIQTNVPKHYCFRAIENKDLNFFYEEELKQRGQLHLPPFKHLAAVKLRASKEAKVKRISGDLFNKLKSINKDSRINIVGVNPGNPAKLRGNFYWEILVKGNSPFKMAEFLKLNLKNFLRSGIIITIDMDPL